MYKMHALIACLALGTVGCASPIKQVDLYGGGLSFKIRKDAKETTVKSAQIPGCMYNMGDGPMRHSCPLMTRLHNTKNDSTMQIMSFPVQFETFMNDLDLQWSLEQYFDEPFRTQGDPVHGPLLAHPNIVMRDLTWPKDKRGVWKERVVVLRVNDQKKNKEYTVLMVGHWSETLHQEMTAIQDGIIFDIWSSAKKSK